MLVVNEVFEVLSRMVVGQVMAVFTHEGTESSVVRTPRGWRFGKRAFTDVRSVSEVVEKWQQSKRSPRPRTTTSDAPLSQAGRDFMAEHYHYALRAAMRVAKSLDVVECVETVEDIVEGAAVEALISVARKFDDPAFDRDNVKPFLFTAVRRAVRWALQKHFGTKERRKRPNTPADTTSGWMPDRRFPDPFAEAVRREDEARNHLLIERTRRILGQFAEVRQLDGSPDEYRTLQTKSQELGLSKKGSTAELRERIAAHIRHRLFVSPTPSPVPEVAHSPSTSQTPVEPKSQRRSAADVWEQRTAFAFAWCHSRSILEVANRLAWTHKQVMKMACLFRRSGVALPKLPMDPPHSIIRSIRDFPPSTN